MYAPSWITGFPTRERVYGSVLRTPCGMMGMWVNAARLLEEEFLFRGALQTRLRWLRGPGWALVIQALVFGAWHLGLGYATTDYAGFLPALASTLSHQPSDPWAGVRRDLRADTQPARAVHRPYRGQQRGIGWGGLALEQLWQAALVRGSAGSRLTRAESVLWSSEPPGRVAPTTTRGGATARAGGGP